MTRVRAHQRKDGSRVRAHDRQAAQPGERRGVDPDTAAAAAAGSAESDAAVHRRADTHRELAAAQEERERPKKGTLSPEMLAEVRRRATAAPAAADSDCGSTEVAAEAAPGSTPSKPLGLVLAEHDRLDRIDGLRRRAERYRTRVGLTEFQEQQFREQADADEAESKRLLAEVAAGTPPAGWELVAAHEEPRDPQVDAVTAAVTAPKSSASTSSATN